MNDASPLTPAAKPAAEPPKAAAAPVAPLAAKPAKLVDLAQPAGTPVGSPKPAVAPGMVPVVAPKPAETPRPQQPGAAVKPPPAAGSSSPAAVVPDGLLERARREAERLRRRKSQMVALRMFVFVIAPALLTAYYLHYWATPYYESEANFTIQSSETSTIPSLDALGGQFMGVANAQDAATIQEFILSRNTMRRIEQDEGYLTHFRSETIDPLRRLSKEASEDSQLSFYRDRVKVAFNPNDQVMTLSAQAIDPDYARRIVAQLIQYSEEKINDISSRIRDDQLRTAQRELDQRRAELRQARQSLLALQQRYGEPDPLSMLTTLVGRHAALETSISLKNAEYQALQWNPGGDGRGTQAGQKFMAEINSLRDESRRVSQEIAASAPRLTEFEVALFEKETWQTIWTSAVAASEKAQAEALRQHRYLALVNEPLAPVDPRYPLVLRSTLLALVFCFFLYNILALIVMAVREHAKI